MRIADLRREGELSQPETLQSIERMLSIRKRKRLPEFVASGSARRSTQPTKHCFTPNSTTASVDDPETELFFASY